MGNIKIVIRKFLLFFIVSCSFVIATYAEETTEDLIDALKEASTIEESLLRLEAYDSILEKYGIRTAAASDNSSEPENKWYVTVDEDPMDDSKRIIFMLTADEGVNAFGESIVLVLRYNAGKTEIFINWDTYLGSEAFVTIRVGKKDPETYKWPISTSSEATFYPRDGLLLVRELLEADQFVARVTPYGDNPITAVFDVSGLKDAAKPYRETLGWW